MKSSGFFPREERPFYVGLFIGTVLFCVVKIILSGYVEDIMRDQCAALSFAISCFTGLFLAEKRLDASDIK